MLTASFNAGADIMFTDPKDGPMTVVSRKLLARLGALAVVLGLMIVVPAGAYIIPRPAGSPGGPPTAPNQTKGTHATSVGATALGDLLAGFTAGELVNQQTFKLPVQFPRAGTIYGRVGAAGIGELGEGFAGRANAGSKVMSVSLSLQGRAYLASVNGKAVLLTIKYAFQPNKGKTKYSTVQIETAA